MKRASAGTTAHAALTALLLVVIEGRGDAAVQFMDPAPRASDPPNVSRPEALRDGLRRAVAQRTAALAQEVLHRATTALTDGDAEVRRLAATVALLGPPLAEGDAERLAAVLRAAPDRDLRQIEEHVGLGLAAGHLEVLGALRARPDAAAHWVYADLVAKAPADAAAPALRDALADAPSNAVPHLLAALGRVAGPEAAPRMALLLRSDASAARDAARGALDAMHDRLLGKGDLAGAGQALAAARRVLPADPSWILRQARLEGVYAGRSADGLALLDAELARDALLRGSPEAAPVAELHTARAAVSLFGGDGDGAAAAVAAGRAALPRPERHARDAGVTWTRLRLIGGLVELARGDEHAAREAVHAAIEGAPYDTLECGFDRAWTGALGPRACLDHLRRTDRVELALRFLGLVDDALVVADQGLLGIGAATDAPDAGTEEARQLNERVKSWIPWYRLEMLIAAGHLDDAAACAERIVRWLDGSDVFGNRNMAAQALLGLGHARLLQRDAAAAEAAFRRAGDALEDLGRVWLDSDMRDRVALFEAGSPSVRLPLADLTAAAWVGVAESRALVGEGEAAVVEALERALSFAPDAPRATLLAARAFAGDDPARARRVLAAAAPNAWTLRDRARVLYALGDADAADREFEQYLDWTAAPAARRDAERALREAHPWR